MVERLMQLFSLGVDTVLWILLVASVVVVAVGIERTVVFVLRWPRFAMLRRKVLQWREGQDDALSDLQGDKSVAGIVLGAAFANRHLAPEALQELVESVLLEERERLERGLGILATLGSNAPFIGLLGTVLGIIRAFEDLARAQVAGPQVVMGGISEALVATAVGLAVAIPALILYNVFKLRIRTLTNRTLALVKLLQSAHVQQELELATSKKQRGGM